MTPVIPGAPAEVDLEKALGSDAARESFYVYGGALAQLLARLGAYTHHPIDETEYHDQKAVGYPHERMRKDRIPLDPTLRFEEYAHLLSRGRAVCAIIARHPSTPQAIVLEIARGARAAANAPPPPAMIAAPPPPEPVIEDAELERILDAAGRRESPVFRQLFRGRDDLYPTRFVSKKTGKAGYAPACSNKFVLGVCELPKVRCGDCTNQAFRPVDDDALLAHLRGKQVMGIYPMLPDETCWFLAVDFDKSTWKDDVRAFAETARRLGLPALVERSRSGNGAHVWFFFSEPVAAATARKMGCHLVTETGR